MKAPVTPTRAASFSRGDGSNNAKPNTSNRLFVTVLISLVCLVFGGLFLNKSSCLFGTSTDIATIHDKKNLKHRSSTGGAAVVADATSGRLFKMQKVREIPTSLHQFQTGSESKNKNKNISWPKGPLWSHPECRHWGVVTTIFDPSQAVKKFVQDTQAHEGWCLVVSGDHKGPLAYDTTSSPTQPEIKNVVFLAAEHQRELAQHIPFVGLMPWNHFARKNVAYLYAIANNAETIFDFDDDNELITDWIFRLVDLHHPSGGAATTAAIAVNASLPVVDETCQAINPYPIYKPNTQELIWPRGYPLENINRKECTVETTSPIQMAVDQVGVYQMMANGDPDVDAIYRQTRTIPVFFEPVNEERTPILLAPHKQFFPFNAQATLWKRQAFWGLLLPITVHGRVSDIWRSYVVQTIFRFLNCHAAYLGPHVRQDRNAHTYLADFDAEKPLYDRAGALIHFLLDWKPTRFGGNQMTATSLLEDLLIDLVEHDILQLEDLTNTQEWLHTLHALGYSMPSLSGPTAI